MRKTLIALTAVCALAFGSSTMAFANGNGGAGGSGAGATGGAGGSNNGNTHVHIGNINIGSSVFNIGGQDNGAHSVSGVLNDQNVTGNFSQGIFNN